MKDYIEKLLSGKDLSEDEIETAFEQIMTGKADDMEIAAFLVALRAKAESPEEIAGAARVMRSKVNRVNVGTDVIDTCGTGGDGARTFNISTAVAFVLAGAGYKVAKHGNRSVSSSSGSADCLEALGVPINLGPEDAAKAISEKGFAFLFAPNYHPSMKYAMPARKKLGIRTIFNVLGPLTNPAFASHQVIGVFSKGLVTPIADVLKMLGLKAAMVVNSGMDEVSISGPTDYALLKGGEVITGTVTPEDAGVARSSIDALVVKNAAESAKIIEDVFAGKVDGPCLDAVLINSAAAFIVLDEARDFREGVDKAGVVIKEGLAFKALNRARGH
ncbi:MAG TPA: anthranilate phosphoribosyltransferase [Desulfomonilia bacterium]